MQFKAPGNTPIYLALTSGHTAVVGLEYAELDPRFHREAIAAGAIPEGIAVAAAPAPAPIFDREKVIFEAMDKMLDSDEDENFTTDGKPNATKLSALVGFTVDSQERNAMWEKFRATK